MKYPQTLLRNFHFYVNSPFKSAIFAMIKVKSGHSEIFRGRHGARRLPLNTPWTVIQGDQLYIAVCFWYLVKIGSSSVQ